MQRLDLTSVIRNVATMSMEAQHILDSVDSHAKEVLLAEQRVNDVIKKADVKINDILNLPFIVSSNQVWHKARIEGSQFQPALWQTACGWRFAFSSYTRERVGPPLTTLYTSLCEKCMPELRSAAKLQMMNGACQGSDTSDSEA